MDTKLVIVGGVAGGATAAARARRLNERAEIVLFERGEHISFANCGLPYYIGGIIENRKSLLVTTREAFMKRYNVDVRINCEVTAIRRDKKVVQVRNLESGETYEEPYDKLILSPGAEPVRPPLPGIDLDGVFRLRNIPDSDLIKAMLDTRKPQSAVVVGGGYIGLEMVENLLHRGVRTTVVEMSNQVMAPLDPEMAAIAQAHLREKGVRLELGTAVESLERGADGLVVGTSGGERIRCDMVILSVGVKPENRLAKEAGLRLGERGGIVTDSGMRTSDPDIFAVGDAVELKDYVTGDPGMFALAGPANKQARIAADNAMGRQSVYNGALGTSIVRLFSLTIAGTGANEKRLKECGIPYAVSYTHSGSHASYYPGSKPMAIKLVFSPDEGKLLGGQIVGEDGVDKRIDVLATAIHGGMTVFDLEELELAYAPPYSSAKDPINMAGFVASNVMRGDLDVVHWNSYSELNSDDTVLLDLRTKKEIEKLGTIPGALHIPVDELRAGLGTLDRDKDYIAFCAVGMRGYLAHRILVQNGFKSKNLSGGFRTLVNAKEEIMRESPDMELWRSE